MVKHGLGTELRTELGNQEWSELMCFHEIEAKYSGRVIKVKGANCDLRSCSVGDRWTRPFQDNPQDDLKVKYGFGKMANPNVNQLCYKGYIVYRIGTHVSVSFVKQITLRNMIRNRMYSIHVKTPMSWEIILIFNTGNSSPHTSFDLYI